MSESTDSRNHCIEGHIGPLCEECDVYGVVWDKRYRREALKLSCKSCDSDTELTNMISKILMLCLEIWFI